MALYEYECENCGTRFERIQSMNDEPIRQCPECAGAVHKLFFPAGIIFKGSGWYITDSRKSSSGAVTGDRKPSAEESKTAEGGSKPSEPGDKAKAESKPETKAETKTENKPSGN
jgi:putative FmdB family regulatory protein